MQYIRMRSDQEKALRAESFRTDLSVTAIVRRAVDAYLGLKKPGVEEDAG